MVLHRCCLQHVANVVMLRSAAAVERQILSLDTESCPAGASRMPLNASHRCKSHVAEIEGCIRVIILQRRCCWRGCVAAGAVVVEVTMPSSLEWVQLKVRRRRY